LKVRQLTLVAVVAALAVTGSSSAVVGGSPAEIQQAPWQVLLAQVRGTQTIGTCGGSIIDASRVVTAAHCVYGGFRSPVAPSSLLIRAGISDYVSPRAGDLEQTRAVVSYRIHPGYSQRAEASYDDVAVLHLDTPLDLSGPNVRAVSLPTSGMTFLSGQTAMLAGFGQQASGSAPNGGLYRIDSSVEDPVECGTYNAIVVCASSAAGSACSGDSGSGLIVGSTLVGIASTARNGCPAGGRVVYTNVAAPEILRFIQGEDAPPAAPRRLDEASLDAPAAMQVGQTLTCLPGSWTSEPTFTFRFVDASTGAALQQGRSDGYRLKASDVGRTVRCLVAATTAGGTGTSAATVTGKVAAAPTLAARTATARIGNQAGVQVNLAGVRNVTGSARICVKPSLKVGTQSCRTAPLVGYANRVTATVPVAVKATAPVTTARMAVSATLSDGRKLTTVGLLQLRR
jgi:hypothetical protein